MSNNKTRPFNVPARESKVKKVEVKPNENSKVDSKIWDQAKLAAESQSGGFRGVSKENQRKATQEKYDQLIENDRKQKADFGPILGDV